MVGLSLCLSVLLSHTHTLETNRSTCRHSHPHQVRVERQQDAEERPSGGGQEKKQDVRRQLGPLIHPFNK